MKIFFTLLLATNLSYAATCTDIRQCTTMVSKITGDAYILDKDVKGKLQQVGDIELTKENADYYLSYFLNMAGYTRVKIDDKSWSIINARDVRYMPTQTLSYGKDTIPKTYDHQMVKIKLKNPYAAPEISRNFRPFMSRYGRIIDIKDPGMLLIHDTGVNIHRLISIVEDIDRDITPEERKKYERKERSREKLAQLKAANCSEQKK